MGHYEVLGVTPDASMVEIKKAYLSAARRSHPDFNHATEAQRLTAESRMRAINDAWAVLGDVDRRSSYDRQRIATHQRQRQQPRFHTAASHAPFEPFDDSDDAFDEDSDVAISGASLPRWFTVTPAFLLVGGIVGLVLGGLVGVMLLVSVALMSITLGGVAFLVAPIVAVGMAARSDRGR